MVAIADTLDKPTRKEKKQSINFFSGLKSFFRNKLNNLLDLDKDIGNTWKKTAEVVKRKKKELLTTIRESYKDQEFRKELINKSCIGFIRENIEVLNSLFPNINFDDILNWKSWIYKYKEDELTIWENPNTQIIIWKWYIRLNEYWWIKFRIEDIKKTHTVNKNKKDLSLFIHRNIEKLNSNFSWVNIDQVIKKWRYNEGRNEIEFGDITIWNWYVKYRKNANQKPIFYIVEDTENKVEGVIVKLNSFNRNTSPDLTLRFTSWNEVNLSFQHIFNYIKFFNLKDTKIFMYELSKEWGFEERPIRLKDIAINSIHRIINWIETDYHFSDIRVI